MYILPYFGINLPGSGAISGGQKIANISNDALSSIYSLLNSTLINIAIQVLVAGVILLVIIKFTTRTVSSHRGVKPRKWFGAKYR